MARKTTTSGRSAKSSTRQKAEASIKKTSTRTKRAKKPNPLDNPEELAKTLAHVAIDKKAFDVIVLYVGELTSIADCFVFMSGMSPPHVNALAEHMQAEIKKKGRLPLGVEGVGEGKWALLDYGDVVVHVFGEETRDFYQLEKLWLEAPQIEVEGGAQGE